MKILVSAWGSSGEHVPVAALCKKLLRHGHHVHALASEAHKELYPVPTRQFHSLKSIRLQDYAGLRLHLSGEVVRHLVDGVAVEQFSLATQVIADHAIDIVMASWITPGVIAAAQVLDVRVVPLYLYPLAMMLEGDLPAFTRWPRLTAACRFPVQAHAVRRSILTFFRRLSPQLMTLRSSHGLADDDGLLPGAGGKGLALFPPQLLRVPVNHAFVPMDYGAQGTLPETVTTFISNGPAPWLIFLGSLTHLRVDLVRRIASLLAGMNERSIIVWGTHSTGGVSCRSILELGYFSIEDLLPHVKAVVHHAGINTVAATLTAGKPAMAIPYVGDQLDNACRLASLGAGIIMNPHRLDDASLRRGFQDLMRPEHKDAARALGHTIQSQSTDVLSEPAIQLIESGPVE